MPHAALSYEYNSSGIKAYAPVRSTTYHYDSPWYPPTNDTASQAANRSSISITPKSRTYIQAGTSRCVEYAAAIIPREHTYTDGRTGGRRAVSGTRTRTIYTGCVHDRAERQRFAASRICGLIKASLPGTTYRGKHHCHERQNRRFSDSQNAGGGSVSFIAYNTWHTATAVHRKTRQKDTHQRESATHGRSAPRLPPPTANFSARTRTVCRTNESKPP